MLCCSVFYSKMFLFVYLPIAVFTIVQGKTHNFGTDIWKAYQVLQKYPLFYRLKNVEFRSNHLTAVNENVAQFIWELHIKLFELWRSRYGCKVVYQGERVLKYWVFVYSFNQCTLFLFPSYIYKIGVELLTEYVQGECALKVDNTGCCSEGMKCVSDNACAYRLFDVQTIGYKLSFTTGLVCATRLYRSNAALPVCPKWYVGFVPVVVFWRYVMRSLKEKPIWGIHLPYWRREIWGYDLFFTYSCLHPRHCSSLGGI